MSGLRVTICHRHLVNGEPERPEVIAALRDLGHRVREIDDGPIDLAGEDLLWMQGNSGWYPRICRQLERAGNDRPRVVLWHTEPLPPPPGLGLPRPRLHWREIARIVRLDRGATDVYTNASRLRKLTRRGLPDVLVVSSRIRQEYLAARKIQSHFVPLGYHAATHGKNLGLTRDIDVLFLGTMQVTHRQKLVASLRSAGINVRTEGSWTDRRSSWGDARTELLNRTKILLNLPRHAGELSGLRMILGMANGAMMICEPIHRPEPYVDGRHYVTAQIDEMPRLIRHYLDHPQEREQFVRQGEELLRELTMESSVDRILNLAIARNEVAPARTPPTNTERAGVAV